MPFSSYGGNYGGSSYNPPPGYRLVPDDRMMTRQQQLEAQARGQQPTLANYDQTQPQPQNGPKYHLPARYVMPEEDVPPIEVPQDGTISVFVQNDLKAVYLRQVNGRGLIDVVKYVPEKPEEEAPVQNDFQPSKIKAEVDFTALEERIVAPLMAEINELKKAVNRKPYHKPYNNNKPKGDQNDGTERND